MLYSIAKKSGSLHELKNIKKIRDKAFKNRGDYSSEYSSDESYSDSFLSKDIDWYEDRQSAEYREINRLYHVVTDNIKANKDQQNDAMGNEPKFDNIFDLSSITKDLPPVVTFIFQGVKKKKINDCC